VLHRCLTKCPKQQCLELFLRFYTGVERHVLHIDARSNFLEM
jgi:hypothetical protein